MRKEIKNLKSKKKTEEELFQESLKVFKESQGEIVNRSDGENGQIELKDKEQRLETLLEYKNNLHILANNSNITITTVNYLLGSLPFDSALRSHFERTIVSSIKRFKAKPRNKEGMEFNKPLAGLPRYRRINRLLL